MNLLIRIGRYQRKTGVSDSHFGKLVIGDRGLLKRMKNGSDIKPKTELRIKAFLDREDS